MSKSTVADIRARFDQDVERFASLETGHAAMLDGRLILELLTQAATEATPGAKSLLDIGCGAGNYTLKLLQRLPNLDVSLVDLSQPMLERAAERIRPATSGSVSAYQADIRDLELGAERFDIILAAAVFHHLRSEVEWELVFSRCYAALRPGGGLWIADMVEHDHGAIQRVMEERYGGYLAQLKGDAYRQQVFDYIEKEDTPRPLLYQAHLLTQVGFTQVEILHKNSLFAAFGGIK
jgi:tRNA (cmo5U34)-methyltransferase